MHALHISSIFRAILILSTITLFISCGGGGGGGGSPTDTTSPSVTSTNPIDGTIDVETDGVVTVTFSEEMDASTINAGTFVVNKGSSKLTGTVIYDSNTRTATFTPSGRLALVAQYIATIKTGVKDLAGNPMSANNTWSFTSRDGVWGAPVHINAEGAGSALLPQIAMNSSGDAIAVWGQSDGTQFSIWENRYVSSTGWNTPALIESDDTRLFQSPNIAMDSSGNAIAVWLHNDSGSFHIWENRYVEGTGWGTAALLKDTVGPYIDPRIAMDSSGNAVAVWCGGDGGTQYSIWANQYVAGTGWGTPAHIETGAENAFWPDLAMDSSGNAIAVWYQSDGVRNNIWANRYVAGTGWGTAELIETDDGDAANSAIAMDLDGNAIAVWGQSDGTRYNMWANRYVAGTGWGTPVLIETDDGWAGSPDIAMDDSGSAIAVWTQNDGARNNIWANRYVSSTGWSTPELIETYDTGGANSSKVVIDSGGNAIAMWSQWDGTRKSIWSNRYVSGTGWGTPVVIEVDTGDPFLGNFQIAIDSGGNVIAVWDHYDGVRENIRANQFN